MSEQAESRETKFDTVTAKYVESFENFSNSKSGNLILDFVLFKRNIVPYTLQILYVLGVVVLWLIGIAGLVGKGLIGLYFPQYIQSLIVSVLLIVIGPFALHYVLEIVKVLWGFIVHVYEKILVPVWQTIAIRFFANVAPQILPFLYERFMKLVDIVIDRAGPALDAAIDGVIAIAMSIAALLKGVLWLPKTLCERLGRWAKKPEAEKAA